MRLMELFSVRDPDVLMGGLDELLPELIFKFWGSSVDLDILKVFVELELVELFLLELFEGFLDGDFRCVVLEGVVFFVVQIFHIAVRE
jgi:hypothetical protein